MNIEKRQRLIETLIMLGGLAGTLLATFHMSNYVFVIFPVFILFSLIYYISILEVYEKSLSNLFITFMVSISFSGLFLILLMTGMTSIDIFEMTELVIVYGILSFLITIELSGYSIDVKVVKKSEKEEKKKQ